MTNNLNLRGSSRSGSIVARPPTAAPPSPRRSRRPRLIAASVAAAGLALGGIGVLIYDAVSEPSTKPLQIEGDTTQQVPEAAGSAEVTSGRMLRPGLADGVFEPAVVETVASSGSGRMLRPGLADGVFEPPAAEDVGATSATVIGCRTTGPC